MSRYIDIRNLQDSKGNVYYPQTHAEAVEGLDVNDIENSITELEGSVNTISETLSQKSDDSQQQDVINKQQEKINGLDENIQFLSSALSDVVGDTGWKDYEVAKGFDKNGGLKSGFKCGIREIRVGNKQSPIVRIRTIRINIGLLPHNLPVAKLPIGFVDEVIRFVPGVSSGHTPPVIGIDPDGTVKVYFPSEDRDGNQWVYGQYTWIVN